MFSIYWVFLIYRRILTNHQVQNILSSIKRYQLELLNYVQFDLYQLAQVFFKQTKLMEIMRKFLHLFCPPSTAKLNFMENWVHFVSTLCHNLNFSLAIFFLGNFLFFCCCNDSSIYWRIWIHWIVIFCSNKASFFIEYFTFLNFFIFYYNYIVITLFRIINIW